MYSSMHTYVCLLDWVKCIAIRISMCNQVHMGATESKALCILLTGAIFLLIIQRVREAYTHVYHLVNRKLLSQYKSCYCDTTK